MATLDQSQVAGSTLGYAQITASAVTGSASWQQVPGLSLTVTVPSGGRRVRISYHAVLQAGNSSAGIWEGTVGTGTQLSQANIGTSNQFVKCEAVVTPSAGSHTYNIGTINGTGTIVTAASAFPAFILVELI
jgi:uncharacterized cupin superfamily protein